MPPINPAPEPSSTDLESSTTEFNYAMDLWDRSNERSIINIVPPATAASMIEAGKREPGLFEMDERDLKRRVSPSPTDNRLRLAFWTEYDRSQATQKRMNMISVYAGVCSRQYFEEKYMKTPERVAWLLCMPHNYETVLNESIAYGLEQMRDILALPTDGPKGQNVKLLELKAKVYAMLEMRKHGGHTQRIENRNLSVNLHTNDKAIAKQMADGSMEEIEARLKYLENRERKALNLPAREAEVVVDSETVE